MREKKRFDSKDAPDGYVAVQADVYDCEGCVFLFSGEDCHNRACLPARGRTDVALSSKRRSVLMSGTTSTIRMPKDGD